MSFSGGPDRTLLGHTEQWYAGDEGVRRGRSICPTTARRARPGRGRDAAARRDQWVGVAVGVMSLSATDERAGVPRAFVARDVLDARDPGDAVRRATRSGRAGGYSYLAAFPGGRALAVETTATTGAVVDTDVHTNHALDGIVAGCRVSRLARQPVALDRAARWRPDRRRPSTGCG